MVTDSGRSALAELSALLDYGRETLNSDLASNPGRAAAFVEQAGPAMLLLHFPGVSMRLIERRLEAMLPGEPSRAAEKRQRYASSDGDPFTVGSLAGTFGPAPDDGLDEALRAIEREVAAAITSGTSGDGE